MKERIRVEGKLIYDSSASILFAPINIQKL